MAILTKTEKYVAETYARYFGKTADANTIKDYVSIGKTSKILQQIIEDADIAQYNVHGNDLQAEVHNEFQNLFSRNATNKELEKYVKVLQKGKDLPINSIVKKATKFDKDVYNNKQAIAEYVAKNGGGVFDLSKVTKLNPIKVESLTSLADLQAKIDALPENSKVPSTFDGETYILTTGVDNIKGTAKNDLVEGATILDASNAVSTTSTFTVVDKIALGAGTKDTFNLSVSGGTVAGSAVQAADITGLEVLNVRNVSAGTVTLDASTISGLTSVNSDKSTSDLTVTDLAKGATAGVIGNGTVTNGNSSFTYVNDATEAVLNISNGTKAGTIALVGAGVTTATINSTGAANTTGAITINGDNATSLKINAKTNLTATYTDTDSSITTITVAGDAQSVNIGSLNNVVKTVDASGMAKGGLTTTLGTGVTSFKGGAGSDVVTANATTDANAKIDAGAGTDKLVIGTNTTVVDTAAEAARFTNFETLSLNGTLDVSLIAGITAIELSAATNNISKLSATQAANVTATGNIGATTIALADSNGTADVLSLTMGDGKGNAFDAGALTINGFETLNVKANGISTSANKTTTIGSFVADKLEKINLAGTAVTLTSAATTKAVTIDASALTGNGAAATATQGLTITTGLTAGSTVIGSSVNDKVTLAAVAAVGSTFNLGAGDDKINSTVANLRTTAVYNTIDGGAGKDTLAIDNGATTAVTLIDDDFKGITNVEAITIATSTTGDQIITTGGWYNANFKAAGSEITTEATTGDITFAGGTFEGNQTITATTAGTGVGEGKITITTGSGNDTVKASAAAPGDDGVINTGAGNDTIELVGLDAFTITGGAGNDTIKLNAANNLADTIVFGSTAALNGVDAITGFKFGNTALTDDVLKVTAFTGPKAFLAPAAISSGIDMVAGGAKNVTALTDIQDLTSANFGAVASNTVIKTAADSKYFIIADKAGDADAIQNMYYVETNASNVATVTLVGTINEGTLDTVNIA